eukprot:3627536-Lingulodinium_polyedra.AAC.1
MMAKWAVICTVKKRLYLRGPGDVELTLPPGSQVFELEQSPSNHLLLPVSDFHTIREQTDKLAPRTHA